MALDGKSAIVTGAANGIGYAIAERFLREGCRVMVADIDAEKGASALEDLKKLGEVRFRKVDVGKRLDVHNLVAATIDAFGDIDILVSNAGIVHGADFLDITEEDFDRVMRVNLKGVFLTGQAVARYMIRRGAGKIINICSVMSALARPSIAPYAASKAAVANLTRGMATDWARHGLNVNAIAPGYIRTELNEALLKDAEFNTWVERRTPMGRWAEPSELGGAAIFLASDAASFVNGHILYVDGGFTATV